MAITLPTDHAPKPNVPVCGPSGERNTLPQRPLDLAPRSIDELLDEAKARAVFLASLVAASGIDELDAKMQGPFTMYARSLFQAAISMRLDDLIDARVCQYDLEAYAELALEVFDLIVTGHLERSRLTSPLH